MDYRFWTKLAVPLAMVSQLVACYGPVWPSRGITVQISRPGPSTLEVKSFVATELQKQGFSEMSKGGLEQIENRRLSFNYEGPNDILVSVGVTQEEEVNIRVSQHRESFTIEASQVFESIASSLEARWPSSVTREPEPIE